MSPKNLNAIKIPKVLEKKLLNSRISKLYNFFEKEFDLEDKFIVAVSGGPDSLALAFLTKLYSLKKKINCKFYIVDHKLRNESTKEALLVKKNLNYINIKSEILTWHGKKPVNNIQSLARKKRYDLLFSKCNKLKIKNLVVGHHIDDMYENFFIRMLRGSGLKGLVSLEKKTTIKKINIIRPLLEFDKKDLIFISKHLFNFYVFWLEPIGMNKTREHMQMYYVGKESANGEELKELRKENSRFWKDVMMEDVSAIEGMQEGRSSPVYNGGNFSPVMDQPTHQFHKWVANSLI